MICPYRDKSWPDERYHHECGLYEAKHQCMIANSVMIPTSAGYSKFVDYVKSAYRNDYLRKFKTKPSDH